MRIDEVEVDSETPLDALTGDKKPLEVAESIDLNTRLLRLTTGISEIEAIFPNIRLNQLNALSKLKDFLSLGKTRGYFRMPTGAGKTILFGLIVKMLNEPTLILVPNINLLKSTQRELEKLGIDPAKIGLVGGGKNDMDRQFTVMTYQSFLTKGAPKKTSLIVCDEVHRSLGDRTRDKIDEVLAGALDLSEEYSITEEEEKAEEEALLKLKVMEAGKAIFGFTATPKLGSKTVDEIHGELIAETFYAEMVKAGFLKWVEAHQVEGEMDEDSEKGPLTRDKEAKLIAINAIQRKMLDAYLEFKESFKEYPLRPIVFCHSVQGAKSFAELLDENKLKYQIVTADEGDLEAAEAALLAGEIDFIIAVKKPMEGWDFPPVNTVLWLRATSSPADLIQGVGRGMRAYENEGVTHLFETNWRVSRKQIDSAGEDQMVVNPGEEVEDLDEDEPAKRRPSSKALTFAQALATLGEDVESVLTNGNDLEYAYIYDLGEEGIVEIPDLGVYCGLSAYCAFKGVDRKSLRKHLKKEGIISAVGIRGRSGNLTVDLYEKAPVDAIILRNRGEKTHFTGKNGTVDIPEFGAACGLSAYAEFKGITPEALEGWLVAEGIKPLQNMKGKSGSRVFDLYSQAEVDKVILENRGEKTYNLSADGTVEIPSYGVACGLNLYSKMKKVSVETLEGWLEKEGIKPLSGVKGRSWPSLVDLYDKTTVDAVLSRRRGEKTVDLSESGEVEAPEGFLCGLTAYAKHKGIAPQTLKKWVEEAEIQPSVGVKGKSGKRTVELYLLTEVLRVIQSKGRS